MSETKTGVIVDENRELVSRNFDDVRAILEEAAELNSQKVFDYGTESGVKEAKAHCRSLRKVHKAIDDKRLSLGADARDQQKLTNEIGNGLLKRVDDMVDVHKAPILAKEKADAERAQKVADLMARLVEFDEVNADSSSAMLIEIEQLKSFTITAEYGERMAEATKLKESILAEMADELDRLKKQEADQAELTKLREEKEHRERKEREKKIADEAAAKAKAEAEAAAKKEAEESANRIKLAEEAREKSERDAAEAADKAKADAAAALVAANQRAEQEAIEAAEREAAAVAAKEKAEREAAEAKVNAEKAEKKRQKDLADKAAKAKAKRLADEKHVGKVMDKAAEAIAGKSGITTKDALLIVSLIKDSEIPGVSIKF